MTPQELETHCRAAKVIPVLTVKGPEDAIPLCEALFAGGLDVLEITLRTEGGLKAIAALRKALPQAIVGAGTLLTADHVKEAVDAGSQFLVTPGTTPKLIQALHDCKVAALPGAATVTEMLALAEAGFHRLKFFPAEPAGGINYIKSVVAPLPFLKFCPTGGIDMAKARAYLAVSNIMCVGGSWVAPGEAVAKKDWKTVTTLAKAARLMTAG
jgi:2-dehydro-3-deoxyphosphogluconate aldolase / (4S)-4-hydroxy-2-oxoglutarate aldolase